MRPSFKLYTFLLAGLSLAMSACGESSDPLEIDPVDCPASCANGCNEDGSCKTNTTPNTCPDKCTNGCNEDGTCKEEEPATDCPKWCKEGCFSDGICKDGYEFGCTKDEEIFALDNPEVILEKCKDKGLVCRHDGHCAAEYFETIWKTEKDDNDILFPTLNTEHCNYTIDWGDGSDVETITECPKEPLKHTYAKGGEHHIKIKGSLDKWNTTKSITSLAYDPCLDNLIGVESFGPVGLGRGAFANAKNMTKLSSIDIPDAVKMTNCNDMFAYTERLNDENITKWDMSHVKTIDGMFSHTENFNQPIGSWNTRNITSMEGVFKGAKAFNQPIGSWDTRNVTTMAGMFREAESFDQPIGDWNTAQVTTLSGMFDGAISFNQPIEDWNTSNVKSIMMTFMGATKFNQPLNKWDVSRVDDMGHTFAGTTSFNQPLDKWNTSKVTIMSYMFRNATAFNQDISSWDVSKVRQFGFMFENATAFNQPIGKWKTTSVKLIFNMFKGATAFDQDISGWDLSQVAGCLDMHEITKDSGVSCEITKALAENNNKLECLKDMNSTCVEN